MIINEPKTIFLAQPTDKLEKIYPGYKLLFNRLKQNLEDTQHIVCSLPLSDIWLRDFTPFQTDKHPISFLYRPPYQSFKKSISIQNECLPFFPNTTSINLRLDGGNLITNNNGIGIATKKPFELNHINEDDFNHILYKLFNIKKMIWLPCLPHEKTAHIDGIAQFINDNTIFVTQKALRSHPDYANILAQKTNCNIIELPYTPNYHTKYGWDSASGLYVNFLHTKNTIIVPVYHSKNDDIALSYFEKYTHKKIIPIYASSIASFGGSIHCITNGQ